jgi:hypothetical protein
MLRDGLMRFGNRDEGGRSRASVEIFVGASDHEIDPITVEPELDHAGGMAHVPYR